MVGVAPVVAALSVKGDVPWSRGRPRFHSAEVLPEFVVWSENLAGNWLQLPRFFVDELPASSPGGL